MNLSLGTASARLPVAHLAKIPLVVNARTDVYLHSNGDERDCFREVVRRAHAHHEAGADCLFVIGLKDRGTIAKLSREVRGPLNILAGQGAPAVSELEQLGVARVTFGSRLLRATLPLVRRIAQELKTSGTCASLSQREYTHSDLNRWFEGANPGAAS